MRSKAKLTAAAVALCLSIGGATTAYAVGGTSHDVAAPHIAVVKSVGSTADGRALFRGIFFGQGTVAQALAKDSDLFSKIGEVYKQNNGATAMKAGDALLDALAKKNPGYFQRFSTEVHSGSPARVQAALLRAPKDLKAIGVGAKDADAGPTCVTIAVAAAGVHIVAALTAAVVAVAEAAVAGANIVIGTNWFWSASKAGSTLTQEEAVAKVTTLLHAA
ncbi:hypothetical protein [Streptomyces sp. NBC_00076]|uniref:hypothetical protein n=1 Tax=Streptomyces sp. NBC_00076 TaxID=2975642 RepID=UPI003251B92D